MVGVELLQRRLQDLPFARLPSAIRHRLSAIGYRASGFGRRARQLHSLDDFAAADLVKKAELLRGIAEETEGAFPGSHVEVNVVKQYRNLGEGLAKEPRAVAYAEEALRRLGREPRLTIIRGGTDGSQLTERGLPTPNLSTGEHNPHSPLEWTCLEEMVEAAELIVELAQVWARGGK